MTDHEWKQFLEQAREQLSTELAATVVRPGHAQTLGRASNLELSIACVDHGEQVFVGSGWELENSAIGQLLVAAGFEIEGRDAMTGYGGHLRWLGSLPEVEARIAKTAKAEREATAAAAEAALSPEQRKQRDEQRATLREAYNQMRIRLVDGALVPFDAEGSPLALDQLSPVQRRAVEEMQLSFVR